MKTEIPPFLTLQILDTRNSLSHRRARLRSYSSFWDRRNRRDILVPPFLSLEFVDSRISPRQRIVPLPNVSVPWDKKSSIENHEIVIPTSLMHFFSNHSFFETQKGSSTNLFGIVKQKISTGYLDAPLLNLEVLDTGNFLRHRSVTLRNVSVLWDKIAFHGKSWKHDSPPYPLPCYANLISKQKASETQNCSSTKCVGTVRQKVFDRKSWNRETHLS